MFHLRSSSSRRGRFGVLVTLIGLALIVVACGNDDSAQDEATTTTRPTTTTSTTTTTEAPTVSRLTGLPVDDEVLERPVVAAKISSDRAAQPQVGLSTADIVVEELVEGGISRFLAVFQSTDSDPVGPVRSARTSEVDLLPLWGRPIFVHSGGNQGTIRALANANTLSAGHNSAWGGLYARDSSRRGPNNLFTNTSVIREAAGESATAPGEQWSFLGEDDSPPAHAMPLAGIDVSFGSTSTRWVWDTERSAFLRWQDGREHLDTEQVQLGFDNVVVLVTPYGTSAADPGSPEAITIGSGEAWILSNGYVVAGSWERTAPDARYIFRDADNNEISLAPGRTWIALPRTGNISFLDADPR